MRLTPEDALGALHTTRLGLSSEEAEYRRGKYGRNDGMPPCRSSKRSFPRAEHTLRAQADSDQ
jgi:hypothetical protein